MFKLVLKFASYYDYVYYGIKYYYTNYYVQIASETNPVVSKDPYILSFPTVPFNPYIPASASQAETLLST
ncbi:MAG: hypothetical protein EZS28_047637 [Streblomastix strix]|uniref:Uncharacterized protein n=1 Tax=Streblomastix strix TaxID=222440 RepID=A0A5J4TEE9_9EUKA|nr:MAG: hypothetical protein EZS28_047637 [Streblomastix strix]